MRICLNNAACRVSRVIVAVEDDVDDHYSALPTTCLTLKQLKELHDIQQSFVSILRDTPGNTTLTEIVIDTGIFQSMPYRLPAALLKPVKDSFDLLLSVDIVEPSLSPWSSQ